MSKSKVKSIVLERFGAHCFYCREALTVKTATIDHFVPRSAERGVPYNKRPACLVCNRMKGALSFRDFRWHIMKLFIQLMLHPFLGGHYDYTNKTH